MKEGKYSRRKDNNREEWLYLARRINGEKYQVVIKSGRLYLGISVVIYMQKSMRNL